MSNWIEDAAKEIAYESTPTVNYHRMKEDYIANIIRKHLPTIDPDAKLEVLKLFSRMENDEQYQARQDDDMNRSDELVIQAFTDLVEAFAAAAVQKAVGERDGEILRLKRLLWDVRGYLAWITTENRPRDKKDAQRFDDTYEMVSRGLREMTAAEQIALIRNSNEEDARAAAAKEEEE